MGWISRLKRRFAPPPMSDDEMTALQNRTDRDRATVHARDEEVRDVSSRLRAQREQNHFGPLIWAALRGEAEPDV